MDLIQACGWSIHPGCGKFDCPHQADPINACYSCRIMNLLGQALCGLAFEHGRLQAELESSPRLHFIRYKRMDLPLDTVDRPPAFWKRYAGEDT